MAISDNQFYDLIEDHPHDLGEDGVCKVCGLSEEHAPPGPCLASLLAKMRDMEVELAFPLLQLDFFRQAVRKAADIRVSMTGETGKFLEIEGASIKVIHPTKPRVTWNSQALEGYAAAHPEILAFKIERWAKPSIIPEIE
jgi:hypothetical protein